MIPRLKKWIKFVYRNSQGLKCFEISRDFVFICTKDEVHQYRTDCPVPITGRLGFEPIFTSFSLDMFFLASKKELFCYKYTIRKVGDLNTLALCLFIDCFLISVDGDNDKIQIYRFDTEKSGLSRDGNCENIMAEKQDSSILNEVKKETSENQNSNTVNREIIKNQLDREIPEKHCSNTINSVNQDLDLLSGEINNVIAEAYERGLRDAMGPKHKQTGLCSSFFITEDKVFLGFENGMICSFLKNSLSNPRTMELEVICCIEESVISLVVSDSSVFILTLLGIFRINKNSLHTQVDNNKLQDNIHRTQHTVDKSKAQEQVNRSKEEVFTAVKGRKLILWSDLLILVQDRRLLIISYGLEILDSYLSLTDIKDAKIVDSHLYVGFSNGLLIQYDLGSIKRAAR